MKPGQAIVVFEDSAEPELGGVIGRCGTIRQVNLRHGICTVQLDSGANVDVALERLIRVPGKVFLERDLKQTDDGWSGACRLQNGREARVHISQWDREDMSFQLRIPVAGTERSWALIEIKVSREADLTRAHATDIVIFFLGHLGHDGQLDDGKD